MSDYLPEAVVVEILVHLPPTTLLRCMSVCKAWNKIIKSHTFISSHLQHSLSKPTPPPLILIHRYLYQPFDLYSSPVPKEKYILYSNATLFPLNRISRLRPPSSIPFRLIELRLVDSLHGIVCFVATGNDYIVLWNPLIQRRDILETDLCHRTSHVALGFGFDSNKNDYKVILNCFCPDKLKLYSLNQDAWRVIDVSYEELGVSELSERGCFLNGNVHWVVFNVHWIELNFLYNPKNILIFNVEEEKFKKMELPAELVSVRRGLKLHIIVIQGCLSVVEYYSCPISESESTNIVRCNIWMMREYGVAESWSKICSSVHLQAGIKAVFGLIGNKSAKVLVLPNEKGKYGSSSSLYSFDTKSQEMTDLEIQDVSFLYQKKKKAEILSAFDCTESLLLFDKRSCLEEQPEEDWFALDHGY